MKTRLSTCRVYWWCKLKITFIYKFFLRTYSSFKGLLFYQVFFSIWDFFHENLRFTEQQEKGRGYSFNLSTPLNLLHGHLDISRVITTGSSPLHIASSRTRIFPRFGFRVQVTKHKLRALKNELFLKLQSIRNLKWSVLKVAVSKKSILITPFLCCK